MMEAILLSILLEFQKDFPTAKLPQAKFEVVQLWIQDVNTGELRRPHGYCDKEHNTILLDPNFWKDSTIWQKRKVVYHEMGHCIYNLEHQPQYPNIMDSNILTPTVNNWTPLVEEFKQQIKTSH